MGVTYTFGVKGHSSMLNGTLSDGNTFRMNPNWKQLWTTIHLWLKWKVQKKENSQEKGEKTDYTVNVNCMRKNVDLSKLKTFARDNSYATQIIEFAFNGIEKIEGNSFSPQCFQKSSSSGSFEIENVRYLR